MTDAVLCVDRTIKKFCWWKDCRRPLPKYKRHYCSNRCATLFAMNHSWTMARVWAIRLSYHSCEGCRVVDVEFADAMVGEHRRVKNLALEVNHIVPLNGAYRAKTCANHQENLETLCHECHRKVTAQQRRKDSGRATASRSPGD